MNQIINYYPKYEDLDYVVSTSGKKKINLFIDLKGCAQSIFQEWVVKLFLEQSRGCNQVDCSFFYSMLEFISFHNVYAKKRGLDFNYFIFLESGNSIYHTEILKSYKEKRHSSDFFGLDLASKDLFFNILNKNYEVMDKVVNKIPKCSFIRLKYLEADFIPWYVLKYVKPELQEDCNIIYSMDKDMIQCMQLNNVYQYFKHYKKKIILSKHNAIQNFLKNEKLDSDKYINSFCLLLSIIGDATDEFAGINGIGGSKVIEILDMLIENSNFTDEKINRKILNKEPLFSNFSGTNNKLLKMVCENEELVVRNLKLSSFELLSNYLNENVNTETILKKKHIFEIVENKNKIQNWVVLHAALNNMSLQSLNISDITIQNLF